MHDNYFSFLDYRAAQRRLGAKFARPRWLMLHTLAFVATMTAIWGYGTGARWWFHPANLSTAAVYGFIWSLALAVHAGLHFRRSAVNAERREVAVEEEMRQLFEKHSSQVDHDTLFAIHRQFEADLARRGRESLALAAFAMVNVVFWGISALNPDSAWAGFQLTLPLAVTIVGGVNVFLLWQRLRHEESASWFVRWPLRHTIAYVVGSIGLWLMANFQMINYWDAETLYLGWSVLLLVHIVWSVLLWPLVQPLLPEKWQSQRVEKRKPAARLALGDDGEVPEIWDEDAVQSQARTS